MSNEPSYLKKGPDAAVMRLISRLSHDATNRRLLVLLVALVAVFGLLVGERFFSTATVQSMAFQLPELGILSLAMMITLVSGGLNLAIIATANLCALTMAYIMTTQVPGAEGFMWVGWQVIAILAGLAVAAVIGLLNGFVIAYLGVSPILTTLGTMTLVKGLAIGMTRGNVLSGLPEPIVFIGNGTIYGIPMAMLVFAAVAIPVAIMLGRTPTGAATYMVGSNEKATRYSGIDTKRVILRVYLISSLLAAVAGLVMMARFNSANASYAESYLLVTILAAVLGGVDPMGGFGKIAGLILSLVILQVISSAFNLLNFSQFLTLAIWGTILVAVMAVPNIRKRLGLRD
jgi:simple sugar transport system permease protein